MTNDAENHDLPNDEPPTSLSDSDVGDTAGQTPDDSRDPFEEIASEFADRQRDGELPSVEDYARKYKYHKLKADYKKRDLEFIYRKVDDEVLSGLDYRKVL